MSDPAYPEVTADLSGWELAEESVETLFRVPAVRVQGATRRYEDAETRRAVREATAGKLDREWRFVSATRIGFVPPLPSGTPGSMILPMVRREARAAFTDRLAERGLGDIERTGDERIRVGNGSRARVTRYGALDSVGGTTVPVTGWVALWHDDGDFFVVTAGHPGIRLSDALNIENGDGVLDRSDGEYREEFVTVLQSVE